MMIIKNLKKVKDLIKKNKNSGRKNVLAEGCFDILHIGHISYLKEAKKQGDVLFVAVNSDRTVRILKGKERPVFPLKERLEIVASLEFVDYAFMYDSTSTNKLLKEIKPDIYAKGTDYTKKKLLEKEGINKFNGKIVIVGDKKIAGDKKTHASSKIFERIKND